MSAQQSQTKTTAKPSSAPVSTGLLQRQCACGNHTLAGDECEECSKQGLTLQRASFSPNESGKEGQGMPPIVHEMLRSSGQPLDSATRSFFEPRFGYDFSQVRVHTDAKAAESARAVNALAYTVGKDVVFGARQYAPYTSSGQKLMTHELTHVMQQTASPIEGKLTLSAPDDRHENEAEQAVQAIISADPRQPLTDGSDSATHRQRKGITNTLLTDARLPPTKVYRKQDLTDDANKIKLDTKKNNPLNRIDPTGLEDDKIKIQKKKLDNLTKKFAVRDSYDKDLKKTIINNKYGLTIGTDKNKNKYIKGKCYYRAQIIGDTLTKEGFENVEYERVKFLNTTYWNDHMAVSVTIDDTKYIIDPALSDTPLIVESKRRINEWHIKMLEYLKTQEGSNNSIEVIPLLPSKTNQYFDENNYQPLSSRSDYSRKELNKYKEDIDKADGPY